MNLRTWFNTSLGAGLVIGVGLLTWSGRAQTPTTASAGWIDGPSDLVEFSSILTRTIPGHPTMTGRFFRGADGSERHEVGPEIDIVELVEIKNIALETYYIWD